MRNAFFSLLVAMLVLGLGGCASDRTAGAGRAPESVRVDPLWQDRGAEPGLVYLTGDVRREGVYTAPAGGMRVEQLVVSAGGVTEGAGEPRLTIERVVEGEKRTVEVSFGSILDADRPLLFAQAEDIVRVSHR